MKNNGLFSSLFIDELKDSVTLNDAAQGRMATLAQTWRSRNTEDAESLWESFLKQALSYLEFVPPGNSTAPGIYPLYEDYNFNKYISVLYLAPPGSDIDNTSVGSFYPAKLLAQLKERKLNWGILTDGARWRLYSTKSSRPYEDYVELPLAEALEGSDEAEYGLFERFFHKDSFIAGETDNPEETSRDESVGIYKCRLDRDRDQSEQVLEEWVKKPFLAQVDEVLQYICNGFIFDTQKSGEEYTEGERAEIFESAVKPLADLYTSYLMDGGIRSDDYHALFYSLAKKQKIQNPLNLDLPKILESLDSYQSSHHFFHWPLEFPDVFGTDAMGGFSANIGNPPWDIVKPNSQEFFSDYDLKFRSYKKQEANRVSKKLMADNPVIAEKWEQYCDRFAEQSAYFKEPLSYSALGKGDINTFKLFLEQFFTVLGDGGRMGIVVSSGIYTDQGCQPLRQRFFSQSRVKFLYGFENRWPTVFSAVDGRFKFITFGTQKGGETDRFKCAFMEHDPERLEAIDTNALRMSVRQVKNFSPNSLTIMEFKSQRDIEIMASIYGERPLLGEKLDDGWNVKLRMGDYHLTNDSHKFEKIGPLLGVLPSNAADLILKLTNNNRYPVYEGKNCWFYDSNVSLPKLCVEKKHTDGIAFHMPRVGFRRIAASTNERTLIPCIIPGKSLCTYGIIFADDNADVPLSLKERIFYAGVLGSFALDFVLRFQINTSISNSNGYSLPVLRTFAG